METTKYNLGSRGGDRFGGYRGPWLLLKKRRNLGSSAEKKTAQNSFGTEVALCLNNMFAECVQNVGTPRGRTTSRDWLSLIYSCLFDGFLKTCSTVFVANKKGPQSVSVLDCFGNTYLMESACCRCFHKCIYK